MEMKRKDFDPIYKSPAATAVLDFEKPLMDLDARINEVHVPLTRKCCIAVALTRALRV